MAERQRFESVQEMLDRLGEMKIIDAQVLLRLYNMYRYQVNDGEDGANTTYSGKAKGYKG